MTLKKRGVVILKSPIWVMIFALGVSLVSPAAIASVWDLKDCIPVDKIDLNPYREIVDGRELGYLMFLRSYISTDPSEPGILKSYEFSPDGKLFSGRINRDLKWSDGSDLKVIEAAEGITKVLPFRLLGHRVHVQRLELVDDATFRITLASDIANLTGVLREALSTNSRHNRFWPIKAGSNKNPDVLAKFPFVRKSGEIGFEAFGRKIRLANKLECSSAEMSIFREALQPPLDSYLLKRSPIASSVFAQINTEKLAVPSRSALIQFLRSAFAQSPVDMGFLTVDSFFMLGESGNDPAVHWEKSIDQTKLKSQTFKIGYEIPMLREVMEEASKKIGLKVNYVALPSKATDLDAQVLVSAIQGGRHLVFQDALQWPHIAEFLKNAPKTKASLMDIAKRSAATIPPDSETMKGLESAAIAEQSIAPLARKHAIAYTKKDAPVCLSWSATGETTFLPKDKCGNDK